jgi:hypothetical protein
MWGEAIGACAQNSFVAMLARIGIARSASATGTIRGIQNKAQSEAHLSIHM